MLCTEFLCMFTAAVVPLHHSFSKILAGYTIAQESMQHTSMLSTSSQFQSQFQSSSKSGLTGIQY